MQAEKEKIEKEVKELKAQNHKMMIWMSKFISNLDNPTKLKIANILNLDSKKSLLDQLQKGRLASMIKYNFYESVEKIMNAYETLLSDKTNNDNDSCIQSNFDHIKTKRQSLRS